MISENYTLNIMCVDYISCIILIGLCVVGLLHWAFGWARIIVPKDCRVFTSRTIFQSRGRYLDIILESKENWKAIDQLHK